MDDDTQQRAEYERDMQAEQQGAIQALAAARTRALTEEEVMRVAWVARLSTEVYQEIRK